MAKALMPAALALSPSKTGGKDLSRRIEPEDAADSGILGLKRVEQAVPIPVGRRPGSGKGRSDGQFAADKAVQEQNTGVVGSLNHREIPSFPIPQNVTECDKVGPNIAPDVTKPGQLSDTL